MQIFLDDERDPVNVLDFVIVRNYTDFVTAVLNSDQSITHISFDHDLGDDSLSGMDCAKYFVGLDQDRRGLLIGSDFTWYVHSQNPVGRENINHYLSNYMDYKFN